MHIAHFIHRYPPAPGGSESYFARLGNYLQSQGDRVTTWTTTAFDLEAFWYRGRRELPTQLHSGANGNEVLRFSHRPFSLSEIYSQSALAYSPTALAVSQHAL